MQMMTETRDHVLPQHPRAEVEKATKTNSDGNERGKKFCFVFFCFAHWHGPSTGLQHFKNIYYGVAVYFKLHRFKC